MGQHKPGCEGAGLKVEGQRARVGSQKLGVFGGAVSKLADEKAPEKVKVIRGTKTPGAARVKPWAGKGLDFTA